MNLEKHIRAAIIDELQRQADNSRSNLKVEIAGDDELVINGHVNLEDLVMVIAGSLAGGP
jgi:hypothetical protein